MNTVLITGSSRGIGRETALVFAQNGWNVAIHGYRHPERLASLEQEIKRLGVQCLSFTGDICNSYFVEQMIAGTISCFGGLDCLVNNAGISRVGLFTDTSEKDWQEMFHTNVMPLFASCKSVLPHMIRRQSGTILNISSVWGGAGASCEVLYSAAKGAVNTFTKALAKEVAPSNISVNAIAFGMIDTEMAGDTGRPDCRSQGSRRDDLSHLHSSPVSDGRDHHLLRRLVNQDFLIESCILFFSRSTLSTVTSTTSPTLTTSRGCFTKRSAIWEMCTSPS